MAAMAASGEVLVIGDLLLDILVSPSGLMQTDADVPATIELLPGGQGGNLAVWLARQGRPVQLRAPLGDDPAGAILRAACAHEHVALTALPAARTGTVVILVDAAARRTMLSDRVAPAGWIEVDPGARAVVCSGYALLDDSGEALARSLSGRPPDCRLAIACCALATERAVARMAERLTIARPDLLVCNSDEAVALLGGPTPLEVAALDLEARLGILAIVTDPDRGSAASRPAMAVVPPAETHGPPVDTTGAGDGYVAGLLDALLDLTWPPTDGELNAAMSAGSALAARTVETLGAQKAGEPRVAGRDRRR